MRPTTCTFFLALTLLPIGCAPLPPWSLPENREPIGEKPFWLQPATASIPGPAHNQGLPAENQPQSIDKRATLAKEYANMGNFADALIQWKIVSTKYPHNPLYREYIVALEQLIEIKAKLHLRLAKRAYAQKRFDTAETEFLKILALNPHHPTPLRYLRRIKQWRVWQNQLAKLERLSAKKSARLHLDAQSSQSKLTKRTHDYEEERIYLELGIELYKRNDLSGSIREIAKFLNSYPDDQIARSFFSQAQLALAKKFHTQGDLQGALSHYEQWLNYTTVDNPRLKQDIVAMRTNLADDFYQKGRRLYRKDISKAIEYLQQCLFYRPQHERARLLLNQAIKMKIKFEGIKKSHEPGNR